RTAGGAGRGPDGAGALADAAARNTGGAEMTEVTRGLPSGRARADERIPLAKPSITRAEQDAVAAVMASDRLAMGPQVEALEARFRDLTGVRHAVAVSSGTAGLHLAVIAAGLGEGDAAITSPYSFVASSNCLLYERALPVFV